jgi:hypothetical protein
MGIYYKYFNNKKCFIFSWNYCTREWSEDDRIQAEAFSLVIINKLLYKAKNFVETETIATAA